ncbi:MAG: DUF4446 family protein [Candidatus Pacebacteria bacterium]|nr:DUF4446 family protein [Candidatus Paceibacterota bacterium]
MFSFSSKKMDGPDIKNLEEAKKYISRLEKKMDEALDKIKEIEKQNKFFFQKAGLVRFNPFGSVGGDQSFSLAMLDTQNNGFIVTSIYTKEGNRIFAKPVENGISKYQLSEEEKEAIKQAK